MYSQLTSSPQGSRSYLHVFYCLHIVVGLGVSVDQQPPGELVLSPCVLVIVGSE